MRRGRFGALLVVLHIVAVVSGAAGAPAHPPVVGVDPSGAGGLPSGFTDGVPVGGDDLAATGAPPRSGSIAPAAVRASDATVETTRYFGRAPFAAIEAAVAATERPCGLEDDALTALVVAPVFKESSAATTPDTAPAPMTLSRYDEWSGQYPPPLGSASDTNRNANYGLYAFRNPSTPFVRAFWNPGIGIWQYDSAGVGAPFTTIETMDVGVTASDVASGMIGRYCAAPPGSTAEARRMAAWSPWGTPCAPCEAIFQELTGSDPAFASLGLVDGISVTGGAQARTCTLAGSLIPVTCWYIDPRVGVIEGATAWATLDPLGGPSPTVAPTPLSAPFYVVDRGVSEERHWLVADTGYDTDITASRAIGQNARPRAALPMSGLTWKASSGLCDLTAGRGSCLPVPPEGTSSSALTVNGTFRPVTLDANGDGGGDVLWYAPGASPDYLWTGSGAGGFAGQTTPVSGAFDDVLAGDVDADGRDDILWYARATGTTYLWRSSDPGPFTSTRLSQAPGLRPLLVDTDGDGGAEVFWYGPGSRPESLWQWSGTGFVPRTRASYAVSGTYTPIVGDLDGNGHDDIFWYAPGATPDHLWLFTGASSIVSKDRPVSGRYQPFVGDLDGDRRADIVWYAPGTVGDHVWFGGGGGNLTDQAFSVSGTYQLVVADLVGDGRDDLIWYTPGGGGDAWWTWRADRTREPTSRLQLSGTQMPVVGGFSAGGKDGILWYGPGAVLDAIWWH